MQAGGNTELDEGYEAAPGVQAVRGTCGVAEGPSKLLQ